MMKPHVVKAIIDNGETYKTEPQVLSVPISEKQRYHERTVSKIIEGGEGLALVDGYRIAGKPAQQKSRWKVNMTPIIQCTFVGWGRDIQISVYVWVENRIRRSGIGFYVAAPVFMMSLKTWQVMLISRLTQSGNRCMQQEVQMIQLTDLFGSFSIQLKAESRCSPKPRLILGRVIPGSIFFAIKGERVDGHAMSRKPWPPEHR